MKYITLYYRFITCHYTVRAAGVSLTRMSLPPSESLSGAGPGAAAAVFGGPPTSAGAAGPGLVPSAGVSEPGPSSDSEAEVSY